MKPTELTSADFDYVRTLVRDRAAIVLEEDKHYLIETRLQTLARADGLRSAREIMEHMRRDRTSSWHTKVVEAMTTNETSFFRDLKPFEALRKMVFPALVAQRRAERRLSVWCAACSTGQEPYSIAMIMRDPAVVPAGWTTRIQATDLATNVLERAKLGRYNQFEVNRGLPAHLLVKYFQKQGTEWQVKDELRSMIEFKLLNLIEPWPNLPETDVVFLRNVLIYFDVETKRRILAKVRRILRPDGYLFLGGAETTLNLDDAFVRVDFDGSGCYRLRSF
ncbi:MAG TPA: protein-glutamate O-methyltransferase CheR [Pirellulales bacterium]|nr:protein-glutamate O-methyltransferase CheR [Pirellulales bacterium]